MKKCFELVHRVSETVRHQVAITNNEHIRVCTLKKISQGQQHEAYN